MKNWDLLPEKQKYDYLSKLLIDIENSKEYQGQEIFENEELEKKKEEDIHELKKVISGELIRDGIFKKTINGKKLVRI